MSTQFWVKSGTMHMILATLTFMAILLILQILPWTVVQEIGHIAVKNDCIHMLDFMYPLALDEVSSLIRTFIII